VLKSTAWLWSGLHAYGVLTQMVEELLHHRYVHRGAVHTSSVYTGKTIDNTLLAYSRPTRSVIDGYKTTCS
jgi:hypothetical protein